jgi:hypothetical protein
MFFVYSRLHTNTEWRTDNSSYSSHKKAKEAEHVTVPPPLSSAACRISKADAVLAHKSRFQKWMFKRQFHKFLAYLNPEYCSDGKNRSNSSDCICWQYPSVILWQVMPDPPRKPAICNVSICPEMKCSLISKTFKNVHLYWILKLIVMCLCLI